MIFRMRPQKDRGEWEQDHMLVEGTTSAKGAGKRLAHGRSLVIAGQGLGGDDRHTKSNRVRPQEASVLVCILFKGCHDFPITLGLLLSPRITY